MTNIARVTWDWTGFRGAPGVTNIYTKAGAASGTGVPFDNWLRSARAFMPDDVHIQLRPDADLIDDATGELVGTEVVGGVGSIDGANTGSYSAPAGICVAWGTAGLVAGRRVRGRTFLVPMSGAFFDTTGQPNGTDLGGLRTGLATYLGIAAGNQVIWSRPRHDPTTGAVTLAGSSHVVTTGSIAQKAAILRSRRD